MSDLFVLIIFAVSLLSMIFVVVAPFILSEIKNARKLKAIEKRIEEREKAKEKEEEEKKKEGENNEGRQKVDVFGTGNDEETFIDNGWLGGDEHKEEDDGDDEKGETK